MIISNIKKNKKQNGLIFENLSFYLGILYVTGYNISMRIVLHSDLNNFYATVECLLDPSLDGYPVVVCGRTEDRHGIVLAKNMIAKKAGVKTGMVLFKARELCPNLKCVVARHDMYIKYSKAVKKIYAEYSDRVESFGIDEAWIDLSGIAKSYEGAERIANEIRKRIKTEIGLTVSIGVSFNKVFAKLGSDLKKPDAVTVITEKDYKTKLWNLPVEDLLYVGRSTKEKLNLLAIKTIGDLARFDKNIIVSRLGKWGEVLHGYANGEDYSEVRKYIEHEEIKSVGNSVTYYKDMTSEDEVEALMLLLAESVASRMVDYGFKKARSISLLIMFNNLDSRVRMCKMSPPTRSSTEFAKYGMKLFKENFDWSQMLVRGLGLSVSDFVESEQLSFEGNDKVEKEEKLESAVENLRKRFGRNILQRGIVLEDKHMSELNIKEDHVVHSGS